MTEEDSIDWIIFNKGHMSFTVAFKGPVVINIDVLSLTLTKHEMSHALAEHG